MKHRNAVLKLITLSSLLLLGAPNSFAVENNQPDPSEATTPLHGNLDLSVDGGYDPNPPSDLNKKTGIKNSYFGISYVPETFDFGTTKLIDAVKEQRITTTKDNEKTFNVGVKDKRRQDDQNWSLNVKHTININNGYQGIELTLPLEAEVKRNMNDGLSQFQSGDLTDQIKKYGKEEVSKAELKTLTISSEDNSIMHTTGGQFVNGVYDLSLGNVTMNIPDASRVPEQTINGSVMWTLTNTPMKQKYLTEEIRSLFKDGNCKELKTWISSTQIKAAKESISKIQDEQQKKYNEDYFTKYVEKNFVEWFARGLRYYEKDISVASVKIFKNADSTRAGLFFEDLEWNAPHTSWSGKDYFSLILQRDNQIILNEHIKGDSHNQYKKSVELKPGDILEIYHAEGKGQRLSVYPEKYKSTNGRSITLRYIINDQFELESINQ
ncbi:hypothetical protein EY693_15585 [Enterococcus casseliflavus]|uniref:WxL domain-containing protein n=1 Tax=Enterococcus casseliflavus TaxID=37734 RepID=UPI001AD644D2|nr:WxL domain-containing protein [Enterococcus casseliflavus]MBO6359124.1 hypothetical protein [Enterococcus casseliflavus]MBO6377701.1 hypothetical protein [Enterococcus casseliflavus]